MTYITVLIPALDTRPPRGAEPLADAALAVAGWVSRMGRVLVDSLQSRRRMTRGHDYALQTKTPCVNGIGSIKG